MRKRFNKQSLNRSIIAISVIYLSLLFCIPLEIVVSEKQFQLPDNFFISYCYDGSSIVSNGKKYDIDLINEEIGEKNPPDKTNWLSVASLNLNYSKIASDIFNVSVVFLIINETHSGNIIFNSIENCYFENLIQTEKYYFPFTVSSIIFNEIKYPISNFQRKDPKIAYNNPLDIGKKGDWTNSPSLFFEERLNIFSFELSSDDDEISIDTILNYEYSSRILISGRLPWICLEILMQLADDSIKEMKGSPVIQLADTNLEFLKDTGIEEPIQGNSLINIGIVVLILGVPMIFTLIWKRNQKKIETNLI